MRQYAGGADKFLGCPIAQNRSNYYTVNITLPAGLTTNTGKTLNFTGELSGFAEIVVDDRSLFERILSPLRYLLKAHAR